MISVVSMKWSHSLVPDPQPKSFSCMIECEIYFLERLDPCNLFYLNFKCFYVFVIFFSKLNFLNY